MFCQNCGKKLPDGAKFCSGCGTPVPVPEDAETSTVSEAAPLEEPAAPYAEETVPMETESSAEDPTAAEEAGEPALEPIPVLEPVEVPAQEVPAEETSVQLKPLTAPAVVAPLPETVPAQSEPILGQKKGHGKALILLAVAAVVLIAAVIGVVKLAGGGGGGGEKPAYVYLTGDDELMFLKDLNPDAEKAEISDERAGGVEFSPDGKYIYFTESKDSGYGDLYRMEIAKIGKEGTEPQKISSEVSYYEFLPDGKLVFLKGSGEDKQLRFFDGTEDHKLASSVSDFTVNEEATHVYYTEQDGGAYTLYRVPLAADGEKEKLVKDANEFFTSLDANPLVYRQDGDGESFSVYSMVPGGEKEKLASDVDEVLDLSILDGGKVRLLYTVADAGEAMDYGTSHAVYCVTSGGEKEKLASGVYNIHGWGKSGDKISLVYTVIDKQAEDSAYTTYTLYSVTSGGEKEKLANDVDEVHVLSIEDGKIDLFYTTMDVETHTLYEFVTDSLAEADANVREPDYEDFETIDSYWGWSTIDWDAYYAARDDWWTVASRNSMREELKEMERNFVSFTVTHYTNGEKTVLVENAASMAHFSEEGMLFIYTKQESKVTTVADLADLEYSYQIYDLMGESGSQTWYVSVNGTESELDLDEDYTPAEIYPLNGSEVVLRAYDKDYADALFHYTIADGELTDGSTVTDEPYAGLTYGFAPNGKEALYYFTDLNEKDSTGELICYTGGEKTTIAKEARTVLILPDGKTIFKVDEMEYNTRREATEGSFYTVADGKSTKVADDVEIYGMAILDAKQILYIGDGDLYFWNGAESTKLASDVTAFWHNQETLDCDSYTCEINYGYGDAQDWDYEDDWGTDWT